MHRIASKQPHRGPDSGGKVWDYSGFGPFRFSLGDYERAFSDLTAALAAQLPTHSP